MAGAEEFTGPRGRSGVQRRSTAAPPRAVVSVTADAAAACGALQAVDDGWQPHLPCRSIASVFVLFMRVRSPASVRGTGP
jgi:hypothetical protein